MSDVVSSQPRGVSPVIGYVLIIAIVLSALLLVFVGGGTILGTISEPRANTVFEPAVESSSDVGIQYTAGDPFKPENTDEIRVIDPKDGTTEIVYSGNGTVTEGDFLVTPSENVTTVHLNTTVEIVWVDANGGDRIVDTVHFPEKDDLPPEVRASHDDGDDDDPDGDDDWGGDYTGNVSTPEAPDGDDPDGGDDGDIGVIID